MGEAFIITCGSLVFFALLFGFILLWRYLNYRETLALAEKGLVKAQRTSDGRSTLRWGIVITAIGLALSLGLWPLGFAFSGLRSAAPLGLGPWMLVGLLPLFFGLALVLIGVWTYDRKKPEEGEGAREE